MAGGQQVTFDVTADTYADLVGNGPMPAGTKINIHTDSDALDSQPLGGFATPRLTVRPPCTYLSPSTRTEFR